MDLKDIIKLTIADLISRELQSGKSVVDVAKQVGRIVTPNIFKGTSPSHTDTQATKPDMAKRALAASKVLDTDVTNTKQMSAMLAGEETREREPTATFGPIEQAVSEVTTALGALTKSANEAARALGHDEKKSGDSVKKSINELLAGTPPKEKEFPGLKVTKPIERPVPASASPAPPKVLTEKAPGPPRGKFSSPGPDTEFGHLKNVPKPGVMHFNPKTSTFQQMEPRSTKFWGKAKSVSKTAEEVFASKVPGPPRGKFSSPGPDTQFGHLRNVPKPGVTEFNPKTSTFQPPKAPDVLAKTGEGVEAGETAGMEVATAAGELVSGIGLATLGVVDLVTKVTAGTIAVKDWGDKVVESTRGLAQWNGHLAVANAKYDIQTTKLEIQQSARTGGSASLVTESQMSLREEFQPLAEDLATLKNVGITALIDVARLMTAVLKTVDSVAHPLIRAIEYWMGSRDDAKLLLPMQALVEHMKFSSRQQSGADRARAREKAKVKLTDTPAKPVEKEAEAATIRSLTGTGFMPHP